MIGNICVSHFGNYPRLPSLRQLRCGNLDNPTGGVKGWGFSLSGTTKRHNVCGKSAFLYQSKAINTSHLRDSKTARPHNGSINTTTFEAVVRPSDIRIASNTHHQDEEKHRGHTYRCRSGSILDPLTQKRSASTFEYEHIGLCDTSTKESPKTKSNAWRQRGRQDDTQNHKHKFLSTTTARRTDV